MIVFASNSLLCCACCVMCFFHDYYTLLFSRDMDWLKAFKNRKKMRKKLLIAYFNMFSNWKFIWTLAKDILLIIIVYCYWMNVKNSMSLYSHYYYHLINRFGFEVFFLLHLFYFHRFIEWRIFIIKRTCYFPIFRVYYYN